MNQHTASAMPYIYSPAHQPNQSSATPSFRLDIHCREVYRKAIRQLLLPLRCCGALLRRETLYRVIEATESAIRLGRAQMKAGGACNW